MKRSSKVDRKTFEAIVSEYEKRIFNTVYRMVGHYEDAMDITQTVFLKAYEKIDLYDPSYKFFGWLYKIAVNESINHLKAKKPTVKISYDLEAHQRTPEEKVLQNHMADRLQSALETLKLEYRTAIVMKYFLDLSYNEISEMLEIPVKTVKSRLFTAREMLRNILIE